MKKTVIGIISCIIMMSCGDSYNPDNGPTECMIENECETCVELKDKMDQVYEDYVNSSSPDEVQTLYEEYEKLSDCYNSSCK